MTGSRKKTRKRILQTINKPPKGGDYVWDGADEDDRPATPAELSAGITEQRRGRGRPPGSSKVSTTVRFDRDVIEAFRAKGPGWQSRMNSALREWLALK